MKAFEEIMPKPTLEVVDKRPISFIQKELGPEAFAHLLTKYGLIIGKFEMCKNRKDYGFVNSYNESAFCHIENNPNLTDYDGEIVTCSVMVGRRGLTGEILEKGDNNSYKVDAYKQIINDDFERRKEIASLNYNPKLKEWERFKAAYEATGIAPLSIDKHHKNNYGRKDWENYTFNKPITEVQFVRWLELAGINIAPETVNAPVCQGKIEYYPTVKTTTPESDKWTRFETKVYYD